MKKNAIISLMIMISIIVLEILPFSAIVKFNWPEEYGEVLKGYFSYFNYTTFKYANFGAFLTAIISCLLLFLISAFLLSGRKVLWNFVCELSLVCFVTSLMPLMFGFDNYTVTGLFITLLLAAVHIIFLRKPRNF